MFLGPANCDSKRYNNNNNKKSNGQATPIASLIARYLIILPDALLLTFTTTGKLEISRDGKVRKLCLSNIITFGSLFFLGIHSKSRYVHSPPAFCLFFCFTSIPIVNRLSSSLVILRRCKQRKKVRDVTYNSLGFSPYLEWGGMKVIPTHSEFSAWLLTFVPCWLIQIWPIFRMSNHLVIHFFSIFFLNNCFGFNLRPEFWYILYLVFFV